MHLNNVGSLWLRRYAVFVACCTFALVIAGAEVASNDAALSVPDWPLSWGHLIPTLEGGIRYEFAHRVAAVLATERRAVVEYVSCADDVTLVELERIEGPAMLSLAARFGPTRLIDNVRLG